MKRIISQSLVIALGSAALIIPLRAMDLPNFYRATSFQGLPATNLRTGTTAITGRYLEGDTRSARDKHEKSTKLFNDRGPCDLTKLGINLEGLDAATKPLTHQFLRGITRDENGDITDAGMFTLLGEKGIGTFCVDGRFEMREFDLEVHQNLIYGFYLQAHLPFREHKLRCIRKSHTGTTPSDEITAPNNVGDDVVFDTFLASFDDILAENDLKAFDTWFTQNGLSDFVIAAGWQGYNNDSFNLISSLQGYVQVGALIPNTQSDPIDRVFFVPHGYGRHFGVNTRFGLQANAFEHFGFGVQGGITILLNESSCRRVPTDCSQRGYLHLEKAFVTVEHGTIWDIGGYLKADHIWGGLSLLAGYNYAKEECSFLTVKDCNYLKTFAAEQFALTPPRLVARDKIASTDPRLGGWNQHTFHVLIEYDLGYHVDNHLIPQMQFLYNHSISGHNSWKTHSIGAQLELIFSWFI